MENLKQKSKMIGNIRSISEESLLHLPKRRCKSYITIRSQSFLFDALFMPNRHLVITDIDTMAHISNDSNIMENLFYKSYMRYPMIKLFGLKEILDINELSTEKGK